jgi:DNA integrity scanning protein DisA with diadenylate cyclase activity
MRQDSAARITRSLLGHVNAIAEACGASAVFVYVDALEGGTLPLDDEIGPKVYYLTKTAAEEAQQEARGTHFIRVPNVPLARMAQLKVAVFLALSRGIVKHGDVIVCLTGMPASGTLDTILVTQVGRELEMFSSDKETEQVPTETRPEVIERVVSIASELGNEGREGKPVGAMFVIGDTERVISLSRQLILNPFRGYEEHERNILDPELEETVKELSTLDGAFIVSGDGVIESCGTFVKTASQDMYELPQGLGARHHSAAAITATTDSLAITVSESTGTVSIFRNGNIVTEIEKLRSLAHAQPPFPPRG